MWLIEFGGWIKLGSCPKCRDIITRRMWSVDSWRGRIVGDWLMWRLAHVAIARSSVYCTVGDELSTDGDVV